jgi:hypothetical protein
MDIDDGQVTIVSADSARKRDSNDLKTSRGSSSAKGGNSRPPSASKGKRKKPTKKSYKYASDDDDDDLSDDEFGDDLYLSRGTRQAEAGL